jgi:hypothetical protein
MCELHLRLTNNDWTSCFLDLTRSEIGVLLYIRTLDPFCDRDIDVTSEKVARSLKLNRSTVSRALKTLEQKGYIVLELLAAKVRSIAKNLAAKRPSQACADAPPPCADAQPPCADAQPPCVSAQDTPPKPLPEKDSGSPQTLNKTNTNFGEDFLSNSPPSHPKEGEREKTFFSDEKVLSDPDREVIKEEDLDPTHKIVSPTAKDTKQSPVVEAEVIPKETTSSACNTLETCGGQVSACVPECIRARSLTQNSSKGFGKPSDPYFGKKTSPLAWQKEKARAASRLGQFKDIEEQGGFFVRATEQLIKDNPKLSPGKAQDEASWMISRLKGEGTISATPRDEMFLQLYRMGQLGSVGFQEIKQNQTREDEIERLKKWSVTGV